jgi:large subunit ribosomal protein L6
MSRIGKLPIPIPKGVEVTLTPTSISVKGPKGQLDLEHHGRVSVAREGDSLVLQRPDDQRQHKAYHGLYQRLVANMIKGVTEQFKKALEIQGVGYRAEMADTRVKISVGYSHPIFYTPPDGITLSCPKPTEIHIIGIDKQKVGQAAAEIRRFRPPDPYKGKGIRYAGEYIKLKEGKTKAK